MSLVLDLLVRLTLDRLSLIETRPVGRRMLSNSRHESAERRRSRSTQFAQLNKQVASWSVRLRSRRRTIAAEPVLTRGAPESARVPFSPHWFAAMILTLPGVAVLQLGSRRGAS